MRLPVNQKLTLAASILLAGCAGAGADRPGELPARQTTGPAADYPMVLGDPFIIEGTTWTPSDQLNYDAVGQAVVAAEGRAGVTAAHKTLPLPSYAEVTSLGTGRTVLVRIERRGPMSNDALVELSRDAARQLGVAPDSRAAVRLRRINPPEQERAMLRQGGPAPERMETPEPLLKVLRRKLAQQSPLLAPPSMPPTMPKEAPAPKPAPSPAPARESGAAPPVSNDDLIVQVGAFSSEANASKAAMQVGGSVSSAGRFWRVRMGPFANRAHAAAALEKARAAGYRDARIQRVD